MKGFFAFTTLSLFLLIPVQAQDGANAAPEDVASIEAIIDATYEAIGRAPGENFDWDRFRSLFLPGATLIPQTEQRGGSLDVLTVQGFIDWIDRATTIGGPNDRGFYEIGFHSQIDRFGDVANVMSSYQKHFHGEDRILGRGINSFQLVWNADRWWITGISWDEENSAGPIPDQFGG